MIKFTLNDLQNYLDHHEHSLSDAEVKEMIQNTRVEMAQRSKLGIFLFSIFIVIAWITSDLPEDTPLLFYSLVTAFIAGAVIRLVMTNTVTSWGRNHSSLWEQGFFYGVLLTSISWGLILGSSYYYYGAVWQSEIMLIYTVGFSAAAISTYHMWLALIRGYLYLIFGPVTIAASLIADGMSVAILTGVLAFVLLLSSHSAQWNRLYWENLLNTRLIQRRADELEVARKKSEEAHLGLLEANRMRDDIESIIRHDLKAPLQAVISIPPMILKWSPLTERRQRMVLGIADSGRRMLEMIEASLNLQKIERGTYSLNSQPLMLIPMLQTIRDELASMLDERGVTLELPSQGGDALTLYAEEMLTQNLLSNIIKNAIEATSPTGKVVVGLECNEQAINIIVTNPGKLDDLERHHFFDKYFTSGKKKGTGLGTYAAKRYTEVQGGTITLDTSIEDLVTIVVQLPLN